MRRFTMSGRYDADMVSCGFCGEQGTMCVSIGTIRLVSRNRQPANPSNVDPMKSVTSATVRCSPEYGGCGVTLWGYMDGAMFRPDSAAAGPG